MLDHRFFEDAYRVGSTTVPGVAGSHTAEVLSRVPTSMRLGIGINGDCARVNHLAAYFNGESPGPSKLFAAILKKLLA